jgi:hypothetical protein
MSRPWADRQGRFWRRLLIALACALATACHGVAPASAAPLTPSSSPLPGSSFQGADGNQDDASPLVDWQALQAAGRVRHSADPNDQDSAFKGGSKEDSAFKGGSKEDEPGDWDLTTEGGGVDPGKANIRDAWSAVDQPGSDTFVYLGFTRQSAEGTTFVAFELNRDSRLWNNGHARIPCRRTGDVLVSYEAAGRSVDVVI